MPTKEEAIVRIKSLVERFDEQKALYQHRDYNETQTRRDFIDPFWKALGWDVDNENGYAESYREVIPCRIYFPSELSLALIVTVSLFFPSELSLALFNNCVAFGTEAKRHIEK